MSERRSLQEATLEEEAEDEPTVSFFRMFRLLLAALIIPNISDCGPRVYRRLQVRRW